MTPLVERCEHESDTGVVLEYSHGAGSRYFVSCGLPACNERASEWLAELEREGIDGQAGAV